MRCPVCSAHLHEDDVDLCEGCEGGWRASPEDERQFRAWTLHGPGPEHANILATAVADYVRRVQSERAHGGGA